MERPIVHFVTGNSWRNEEAKRLLAGIEFRWARVNVAKPPSDDLREIARGRCLDAWRQLRAPCFVENTGMFLDPHAGAPGTKFKRELLALGEPGFAAKYGGGRGRTRVVVAYTADGDDVELFEGESEGELLREGRGVHGHGWDRLWQPDGYVRTLAELEPSVYLVNMRHKPFLELAALLGGDGFDGIFESHVTVAPCEPRAFAAACDALGVKCLTIELPAGAEPVQPMTAAHHRGAYAAVLEQVHEAARELVKRGFTVTRTKLEAVGRHRDLPQSEAQAAAAPRGRYFEHHAKVAVTDVEALRAACGPLGGYVSRNSRKEGERYVTLRSYGVGQREAEARFASLLEAIRGLGVAVLNQIREYTVYDSAIEVDRGWK